MLSLNPLKKQKAVNLARVSIPLSSSVRFFVHFRKFTHEISCRITFSFFHELLPVDKVEGTFVFFCMCGLMRYIQIKNK